MDFYKHIPTHMDYEGQRKAERIFQGIILIHGIIGFVVGYGFQQFSYTVYAILAGFIISCLIVLPPWPYFRRNPLPWQKVSGDSSAPPSTSTGGGKGAGNKKKK